MEDTKWQANQSPSLPRLPSDLAGAGFNPRPFPLRPPARRPVLLPDRSIKLLPPASLVRPALQLLLLPPAIRGARPVVLLRREVARLDHRPQMSGPVHGAKKAGSGAAANRHEQKAQQQVQVAHSLATQLVGGRAVGPLSPNRLSSKRAVTGASHKGGQEGAAWRTMRQTQGWPEPGWPGWGAGASPPSHGLRTCSLPRKQR